MIPFPKPDLNAPRFRRNNLRILNQDFCNSFRQQYPHSTLSDEQIKQIVTCFNGLQWETVIESRDGLEMFESLGNLFIGACPKKKKKNVDFKTSMSLGQIVEHRNTNSDDTVCKIFYTNYEASVKFRFHELWSFKATRDFTRSASEVFKNKWMRYIKVDNRLQVSRLFRKEKHNQKLKRDTEIALENYNEFDL
jgi:hypothetical protein